MHPLAAFNDHGWKVDDFFFRDRFRQRLSHSRKAILTKTDRNHDASLKRTGNVCYYNKRMEAIYK